MAPTGYRGEEDRTSLKICDGGSVDRPQDDRAFFGAQLRRHRNRKGWSQRDLADRMGYQQNYVSMIETGSRTPSLDFAQAADRVFQLPEVFDAMAQKAIATAGRFVDYTEREGEASRIRTYELGMIPGLLQTADYARYAIQALSAQPADIDEEVATRIKRQATLETAHLRAVIDESVLYRPVGDPEVMRAQLARLREPGPTVAVHVLPLAAGLHAGLSGPVTLLDFTDGSTMALADGQGVGELIDDPGQVAELETAYDAILSAAMTEDVSHDWFAAIMEDLT